MEKLNNVSINVIGFEPDNKGKGTLFPLLISKRPSKDPVNLLLLNEDDKSHFILITDMSRLLNDTFKHKEKRHFCLYCFKG